MKASEIKNLLKSLYPDGPSMFLTGPSGVGKSEIIKQTTEELGIAYHVFDMQLQDEVVLRGIPFVEDNWVTWKGSKELPFEGNDLFPEKGILFLDEFNCSRRSLQNLGYQIALEHRIGQFKLKKDWYVCFAGNRETDRAEIFEVPGPLKARVIQIEFTVSLKDWLNWAFSHNVSDEIISYISWSCQNLEEGVDKLGNLINYDPDTTDNAWPNPRAWSRNVNYLLKRNIRSFEAIAGCVGKSAASEFLAYLDVYKDMPKVEDVLDKKVAFPTNVQMQYAISTALIKYCNDSNKVGMLFDRIIDKSIPEEFGTMILNNLLQTNPKIVMMNPNWKKAVGVLGDFLK